jgi:hypothetical protein
MFLDHIPLMIHSSVGHGRLLTLRWRRSLAHIRMCSRSRATGTVHCRASAPTSSGSRAMRPLPAHGSVLPARWTWLHLPQLGPLRWLQHQHQHQQVSLTQQSLTGDFKESSARCWAEQRLGNTRLGFCDALYALWHLSCMAMLLAVL